MMKYNLPTIHRDGFQAADFSELSKTSVDEPLSKPAVHSQYISTHPVLFIPEILNLNAET